MSRLCAGMIGALRGRSMSLKYQDFSRNIWQIFARGNSTQTTGHQQSSILPASSFSHRSELTSNGIQAFLEAKNWSNVGMRLPLLHPFNLNYKILGDMIGWKGDTISWKEESTESVIEETNNNFGYLMGSLLKKRKRKMNRQKYKKRRKRDIFKREALKNLRERKEQRKERAALRKERMLSKMVVNKTMSKRQARYLTHKVFPGHVAKRQSI